MRENFLVDADLAFSPGFDKSSMDVWIARQSSCDAARRIVAYELLHRSPTGRPGEGIEASSEVLLSSLFTFGLDRLSGGRPVYVNVSQNLLSDPRLSLLPPDKIGYEVLEDTEPTPANLAACAALRNAGFRLALDDFFGQPHLLPFLDVVSCVKVDWPADWRCSQGLLFDWKSRTGGVLLAEKIESEEQFDVARGFGFDYFQGYFQGRPSVLTARNLAANAAGRARLLGLFAAPDVELDDLSDPVVRDPELSMLLIKWVNSARFARRSPAVSVHQALSWLGTEESRRWLTVLLLPTLAPGINQFVLSAMLTRARFAEQILARLQALEEGRQAFLVSLAAELAQLSGLPLEQFAKNDELPERLRLQIRAVLNGEGVEILPSAVLLAGKYFDGMWPECDPLLESLGIAAGDVSELYMNAIEWAALLSTDLQGLEVGQQVVLFLRA